MKKCNPSANAIEQMVFPRPKQDFSGMSTLLSSSIFSHPTSNYQNYFLTNAENEKVSLNIFESYVHQVSSSFANRRFYQSIWESVCVCVRERATFEHVGVAARTRKPKKLPLWHRTLLIVIKILIWHVVYVTPNSKLSAKNPCSPDAAKISINEQLVVSSDNAMKGILCGFLTVGVFSCLYCLELFRSFFRFICYMNPIAPSGISCD